MCIRRFFHKIKMGFVRLDGKSIPYVSSTKRYGDTGEQCFFDGLTRAIPLAKIKKNIIINTEEGNAEIDCLILYQNKLFAIEIKRWKGRLTETDKGFLQEKTDKWTRGVHTKYLKSPFKQLNRAIYLLRKQILYKAWVNPIVYFASEEFDCVFMTNENIWFNNVDELVDYIEHDGKITFGNNQVKLFFDKCVASDYLYECCWDDSLHCVINSESLNFITEQGLVTRNDISHINIKHHFSYDELYITMQDGSRRHTTIENGIITVNDGGRFSTYSLCKLDYIELGR